MAGTPRRGGTRLASSRLSIGRFPDRDDTERTFHLHCTVSSRRGRYVAARCVGARTDAVAAFRRMNGWGPSSATKPPGSSLIPDPHASGPYHGPVTRRAGPDVIREAERRRLRALVIPDAALARELHSDDYQLVTPGGEVMSKEDYLGQIESGALDYSIFEPTSEIAVRTYEAVAIIRYQARIEVRQDQQHFSGRFWHTDLYELRNDRWQVVWSQATRIRQ